MDSFEIYKIALNQWNKAMDYHNNIKYTDKKRGNNPARKKSYKERLIQKNEYDKALFYFKLYEHVAKQEERELRKK